MPLPSARPPAHAPLAVVERGGAPESLHYGSVAVVDRTGRLLHATGDPDALIFTRSALKPLQAVPFVNAGGIERFGYSSAQVALMCASHSGEARHVAAVADMLAKAGCTVDELQCGTHAPGFYDARGEIPPPPPWSPLAHNCSGKHAGMLACCVLHKWPKESYLAYDHPLQQMIRTAVAEVTDVDEASLVTGIDGCSAPNYAVPLWRLALAYARLASPDGDVSGAPALRRLADAMLAHPDMVSGEHRNDLALAQAGKGEWVAKIGAEGVQAIGIRSRGWGIAIKVADGASRGLHPATVAVLEQLGLIDAAGRSLLEGWALRKLRNYRGIETGRVRPLVVLDKKNVEKTRVGHP